jgi:hypothetical protein
MTVLYIVFYQDGKQNREVKMCSCLVTKMGIKNIANNFFSKKWQNWNISERRKKIEITLMKELKID